MFQLFVSVLHVIAIFVNGCVLKFIQWANLNVSYPCLQERRVRKRKKMSEEEEKLQNNKDASKLVPIDQLISQQLTHLNNNNNNTKKQPVDDDDGTMHPALRDEVGAGFSPVARDQFWCGEVS